MSTTLQLCIAITLLNVFDFWSTIKILLGGGYERDPMLGFMNRLSPTSRWNALFAVKVVMVAALWRVQVLHGWDRTLVLFQHALPGVTMLAAVCTLYVWAAANNYKVLRQIQLVN